MATEYRVTCDHCGADLTESQGRPAWRLDLEANAIPVTGGMMQAVYIIPPMEGVANFCGFPCLMGWLENRKSGAQHG